MKFPAPLQFARLIRRYKRFLADIELADGRVLTIHCPNTGSMKNCAEPGFGVWFSVSDNPKRKYPNTWEIAEDREGNLIGINASFANKLIKEAVDAGAIEQLSGYRDVASEVKYGLENSRIDLFLTEPGRRDCYVEIKSVTLLDHGRGYFPDSVSTRGQKHLRELAEMVRQGHRAVLMFCVQHSGIQTVQSAAEIDPVYAAVLKEVQEVGVEVYAYGCRLSEMEIVVAKPLLFIAG